MDGPIVTLVVLGNVLVDRVVGRADLPVRRSFGGGGKVGLYRRVRSAGGLRLTNTVHVLVFFLRADLKVGPYRLEIGFFDYRSVIGNVVFGVKSAGVDELRWGDGCLATTGGRDLGLLVFVLRVARGAPRLLHGVVDHRHDRVIGNAALTRTVVVQNVTEPKPALLHENSP